MKLLFIGILCFSFVTLSAQVQEEVYVETHYDTDNDGKKDRVFVRVVRPSDTEDLATIYRVSPYNLGGNDVKFHNTKVKELPQSKLASESEKIDLEQSPALPLVNMQTKIESTKFQYARVYADSIGSGRSTGCPTVGDEVESIAAGYVIDWLNGRATAYDKNNQPIEANWSNGNVGMIGVSYNGTLPIGVASTGIEGLKAIIPVAAISNWYNYYRANGLVVGPGGYIGEDADVLGYYIVRKSKACEQKLPKLFSTIGREHGDYSEFWQKRNYLVNSDKIKAATFIIHGQSDWNVRQKHASDLWNALDGKVPLKMYLHDGGHTMPHSNATSQKVSKWFDRFLYNDNNGIEKEKRVQVEMKSGVFSKEIVKQNNWPSEKTQKKKFYLGNKTLQKQALDQGTVKILDAGKSSSLRMFLQNLSKHDGARAIFLTDKLSGKKLISGSAKLQLSLSVLNKDAANISVALFEYKGSSANMITMGWADPQNARSLKKGEYLVPGKRYNISFELEPKQAYLKSGSQLGLIITATDSNHTLVPNAGTELEVSLGQESFLEVNIN